MLAKDQSAIIGKFLKIMESESQFIPGFDAGLLTEAGARELLGYVTQAFEVCSLALVSRVYNIRYGLTEDTKTFESVSAHTLLLETIVDRFLLFEYGSNFKRTADKYSYREIMEAVRRHDLPEIIIGDQPDNGKRDDKELAKKEQQYWRMFSSLFLNGKTKSEGRINSLLLEMQERRSSTGRALYVADKIALIVMALRCDTKKVSPTMQLNDPDASDNERADMQTCDRCDKNGRFLGSEMWTVDYFKTRRLYRYDSTGFFTAFVVMATLAAHNNRWYHWREKDYALLFK